MSGVDGRVTNIDPRSLGSSPNIVIWLACAAASMALGPLGNTACGVGFVDAQPALVTQASNPSVPHQVLVIRQNVIALFFMVCASLAANLNGIQLHVAPSPVPVSGPGSIASSQ